MKNTDTEMQGGVCKRNRIQEEIKAKKAKLTRGTRHSRLSLEVPSQLVPQMQLQKMLLDENPHSAMPLQSLAVMRNLSQLFGHLLSL